MFDAYLMNTWITSTIVALGAGVIGVFVVMRGDSFLAHAIPHGSFSGAAIAVLLGVSPVAGLGVAAVIAAVLMHALGRKGHRDAVIALILTFLLAGGAFALSLSGDYANQVYALLFGQVLAVSDSDLLAMCILAVVAVTVVLMLIRPLLMTSVLPEQAGVQGIHGGLVALTFTIVIACITTASVPVVGAMLLFSLLIAPPAAACALSHTLGRTIALSCVFTVLCMWVSVALSVVFDFPVGFFVSLTTATVYIAAKLIAKARA